MQHSEHPQFAEIVARLNADSGCAIVQLITKREVGIELNTGESICFVQALIKEAPADETQRALNAAGLEVHTREMRIQFGPDKGKSVQLFTVAGDFENAEQAAGAALAIFINVWAVSNTEWLWVTSRSYDQRGTPNPPPVWPPASA